MSHARFLILTALTLAALMPTRGVSAAGADDEREVVTVRLGPPGLTARERSKFELGSRQSLPAGLMTAHPLRLGHAPAEVAPGPVPAHAIPDAAPTAAELAKLRGLATAAADAIAAPPRAPRRGPGASTKPAGFGTSVPALTPGLTPAELSKLESAGIRRIEGGPQP